MNNCSNVTVDVKSSTKTSSTQISFAEQATRCDNESLPKWHFFQRAAQNEWNAFSFCLAVTWHGIRESECDASKDVAQSNTITIASSLCHPWDWFRMVWLNVAVLVLVHTLWNFVSFVQIDCHIAHRFVEQIDLSPVICDLFDFTQIKIENCHCAIWYDDDCCCCCCWRWCLSNEITICRLLIVVSMCTLALAHTNRLKG